MHSEHIIATVLSLSLFALGTQTIVSSGSNNEPQKEVIGRQSVSVRSAIRSNKMCSEALINNLNKIKKETDQNKINEIKKLKRLMDQISKQNKETIIAGIKQCSLSTRNLLLKLNELSANTENRVLDSLNCYPEFDSIKLTWEQIDDIDGYRLMYDDRVLSVLPQDSTSFTLKNSDVELSGTENILNGFHFAAFKNVNSSVGSYTAIKDDHYTLYIAPQGPKITSVYKDESNNRIQIHFELNDASINDGLVFTIYDTQSGEQQQIPLGTVYKNADGYFTYIPFDTDSSNVKIALSSNSTGSSLKQYDAAEDNSGIVLSTVEAQPYSYSGAEEAISPEITENFGAYSISANSYLYNMNGSELVRSGVSVSAGEYYTGFQSSYYPGYTFIDVDGGLLMLNNEEAGANYLTNAKVLNTACVSQFAAKNGSYMCGATCAEIVLRAEKDVGSDKFSRLDKRNKGINSAEVAAWMSPYGNVQTKFYTDYRSSEWARQAGTLAAKANRNYSLYSDPTLHDELLPSASNDEIVQLIKDSIDNGHRVISCIHAYSSNNGGFTLGLDSKDYYSGQGGKLAESLYIDYCYNVLYHLNEVNIINVEDIRHGYGMIVGDSPILSPYYDPQTDTLTFTLDEYWEIYNAIVPDLNRVYEFLMSQTQHFVVITGYETDSSGNTYFYIADPSYKNSSKRCYINNVERYIYGLRKWNANDVANSMMNSSDGLIMFTD